MQWDLVAAAVEAVLEVLVVASFGAYLGYRRMFPKEAIKVVDKLILHLFIPCLILDSVVPQVHASMFQQLWPLITVCFWNLFWGTTIGFALSVAMHVPHLRGALQACIAFPNTTAVVLTLSQSLTATQPVIDLYRRTANSADVTGRTDGELQVDLFNRATALVLTSTVWWNIAKWSLAYNLLAPEGEKTWKEKALKVVNPPVIACLLAFSLGFIPGVGSWWVGTSKTATVVVGSLQKGGRCLVPCMLLVLGGRIYHSLISEFNAAEQQEDVEAPLYEGVGLEVSTRLQEIDEPTDDEAGDEDEKIDIRAPEMEGFTPRVKFCIIFFRQGVCLGLGVLFMWLLSHGCSEMMMLLICFLQTAGPPMINLSVMAGLHGNHEAGLAQTLMAAYLVSIVTWVLGITVALGVLQQL
eukprot:TRINITY_DN2446_c0_g1_i1.p1 TRINITY_DN2446_c0_g1~~TRINITY_DN2446_c0_g1_i1.p1  ORF type:complete len:410 (+),score=133.57 TRINITY_DN2446_c0_g1_i1:58-1287(+)